jgi:hypothetical protein
VKSFLDFANVMDMLTRVGAKAELLGSISFFAGTVESVKGFGEEISKGARSEV